MPKTEELQNLNVWQWLNPDLAELIVEREVVEVLNLLPDKFYASGIQLGVPSGISYFNEVNGSTQIYINTTPDLINEQLKLANLVVSNADLLPFGRRAVDLIIMPHTLDLNFSPVHVLREVSQVIDDDGTLVLTGFNPASFMGLSKSISKKIKRKKGIAPSYTPRRVKEWLQLIGFEVTASCYIDYLPPIAHPRIRKTLGFIDKAGQRWWPVFAGVYIIIAKKQQWIPERISMFDSLKKRLNRKFPQPATRNRNHG